MRTLIKVFASGSGSIVALGTDIFLLERYAFTVVHLFKMFHQHFNVFAGMFIISRKNACKKGNVVEDLNNQNQFVHNSI